MRLTGPFSQILTLDRLPMNAALKDSDLEVIINGGVLTLEDRIVAVGDFEKLQKEYPGVDVGHIEKPMVLLPGFVDCHTHLCFSGDRSRDYALRTSGKSYLEIAESGGGIWDTVTGTRQTNEEELLRTLTTRAARHFTEGVTTIEVKSGYGLSIEAELKQLRVIRDAAARTSAQLVPTCLAAHLLPKDFPGDHKAYLDHLLSELLPVLLEEKLTKRVDIFIEQSAFSAADALVYLRKAKEMGFELTVHADQFSTGGSSVAVLADALSADHLEASAELEISLLAGSDTVAVALPGASLGLGMGYAPARKLLDAGACLAIASDWNPGSAPMGDLLMQAAVMGAAEKLSTAETFAAVTFRAAKALKFRDRGILSPGMLADMQAYPCADYREILYYQGKLKPSMVWKNGEHHSINPAYL
jgi:imidazolonepropionase